MLLAIFIALSGAMLCMSASAVSGSAVPFPSTYQAIAANATVLRHGTVLIGNGQRLDDADVLLRDGKVQAVGSGLQAPADAVVVDASGNWITPGLLDVHSQDRKSVVEGKSESVRVDSEGCRNIKK